MRSASACWLGLLCAAVAVAAEPVKLENAFSRDAINFVTQPGHATVAGRAFLKLADGSYQTCAGFNIELLPVAAYSRERITRTYGNEQQGQILLEQNPPKFTPDEPEYHELLLKSVCNTEGEFRFERVPAGDYFVMAFIIWDDTTGATPRKTGGAAMKRIHVAEGSTQDVLLRN